MMRPFPFLPALGQVAIVWQFCILLSAGQEPAVVIPGLHGNHPLSERQVGLVLIEELRCAACHDTVSDQSPPPAPNLRFIGSRLNLDWVEKFIANPAKMHPGTAMPQLLEADPEPEKTARALANYLISLQDEKFERIETEDADPERGQQLYHSLGCVVCHAPRDGTDHGMEGVATLDHLVGKYRSGALAAYLHDPLAMHPAGRMPDMKLSRQEASDLAAYLVPEEVSRPEPPGDPALIAEGKRHFQRLQCASCHEMNDPALRPIAPLPAKADLNRSQGCLSPTATNSPRFSLSADQRLAIQKALEPGDGGDSAEEKIAMRLTQLNCIGCHVRDEYGGVSAALNSYFRSTEEGLGNESRIPPPLTLAGAKLRQEWMNRVLYDGESVRPYMTTRMPQFGPVALNGLSEFFTKADHLDPVELAPPDKDSEPMMRNGAHMLLGDKGLNCIACHNYNGKESPALKGIDLMTSYQRLQPAWFYQYMLEPTRFRPGIIMPGYWPGGNAVQTEILNGDTDLQLRALWDNFSLGRSARDPSGLRSEPSKLLVSDRPRTYRGRSQVAGYRGIAVGYPGGINFAFNAQNGALSALWRGGFVNVGWQGQGSGNFSPEGRTVQLAQDVAFLKSETAPANWPLAPVTTKEKPVNPDPLYPRNHGYSFLGYSLDSSFIPTFRYRCHEVEIEDRTVAQRVGETLQLQRTLRFAESDPATLWFRALTGDIVQISEQVFQTKKVTLTISSGKALLRASATGAEELLVPISLPSSEQTLTVTYELRQ